MDSNIKLPVVIERCTNLPDGYKLPEGYIAMTLRTINKSYIVLLKSKYSYCAHCLVACSVMGMFGIHCEIYSNDDMLDSLMIHDDKGGSIIRVSYNASIRWVSTSLIDCQVSRFRHIHISTLGSSLSNV